MVTSIVSGEACHKVGKPKINKNLLRVISTYNRVNHWVEVPLAIKLGATCDTNMHSDRRN